MDVVPDPGPLQSLVDDWWNPILVKEVRQSLRGKFFRVSFICTLAAVTVASFGVILEAGEAYERSGRDFFMAIFVCFGIAIMGLVPFAAFNSMGAEWDENTHDLLVISNLRPRQIVLGKVLSAMAQMVLFLATFTPYLVFSFLLRGMDLTLLTVIVTSAVALSVTASVVAVMLSTLSRVRFARVALLALLAGMLGLLLVGTFGLASEWIRFPAAMQGPDFVLAWSVFFVGQGILIAFCFGIAANMLSHSEENRSSGMRILNTCSIGIGIAFLWYMTNRIHDREFVSAMSMTLLVLALVPGIFFVTEPESLGRRVAPRVPRKLPLALLAAPYMPGGGRGVLLYGFHVVLIGLYFLFGQFIVPAPHSGFLGEGVGALIIAFLYGTVYLLLPSGLLSKYTKSVPMRITARALIPFLVLVFAFVPSIFGFFLGDERLMDLEHAGNPFLYIDDAWNADTIIFLEYWVMISVFFVLTVLLNIRRVFASIVEVVAAWRRRLDIEPAPGPRAEMTDALADA
ncbi:MAG: hypothetical protein GY711_03220 [bacterium]|nr:hypothetical protein [bacterium]